MFEAVILYVLIILIGVLLGAIHAKKNDGN